MDPRQNNGTSDRPSSQYYDQDYQPATNTPLTTKKQSFSARAGRKLDSYPYSSSDQNYFSVQEHSQARLQDNDPSFLANRPLVEAQVSHVLNTRQTHPNATRSVNDRDTVSPQTSARTVPPTFDKSTNGSQRVAHPSTDPSNDRRERYGGKRSLVSDKSPLQRLEGKLDDISKEEKRARVEEAEHRARQRAAAKQSRRVEDQQSRRIEDQHSRRVEDQHSTRPTQPRLSSGQHVPSANVNAVGSWRRHVPDQDSGLLDARRPDTGPVNLETRPNESSNQDTYPAQSSQAIGASRTFKHASDELRVQDHQGYVERDLQSQPSESDHTRNSQGNATLSERDNQSRTSRNLAQQDGLDRGNLKNYRHRSRDAGFAGAAAAAAVGSGAAYGYSMDGAGRRNEHEGMSDRQAQGRNDGGRKPNRTNSEEYSTGNRDTSRVPAGKKQLLSDRVGTIQGLKAAITHQEPDPLSPDAVRISHPRGPGYQIPPQTAAGQHARDQVGFTDAQHQPQQAQNEDSTAHHYRGLAGLFHRHHDQERADRQGLDVNEWRKAGVAKLALADLILDDSVTGKGESHSHAWWESSARDRRSGSNQEQPETRDGPYDEEATSFSPRLYLKCGPLLRYTGLRREQSSRQSRGSRAEREVWRGSVMIVTLDSQSSYDSVPTLRLFSQPMDLLTHPPPDLNQSSNDLPVEYSDPIAGQIKASRTGRPLFVKPVDHVEGGVDHSRIEDDAGLFESTKSPSLGPQQISGPDGRQRQHITITNKSRVKRRNGESAGKYHEIKAARLHAERGVTFWRFNIEVELGFSQARVAYRINKGPAIGFWVPARNQTMNMMFHSCNGFSVSVDSNLFSGPDPLWRDVLNRHQFKPFHVMLGGGDQIYNDAAMRDTKLFGEWLATKNPEHKHKAEFTRDMQNELEQFYLERYSMWFSQGLFSMANSQIPMVNMWDDHDIIDGYGSYPHHFMSTKVFTGLGAVAFKYYMLFQHQSVVAETQHEESSWLLGASPGPYINELSRSIFMFLGRKVAFLGLDCRTERMRDEVLSQDSYDIIFRRCRSEIIKGETKHLIVLLGIPIAYPRLNFLENILTSRAMDPIKAISRAGLLGGFINKFDGGVEILDDLDDHWTAKHHKAERNWFIQELQELASEKSVRVTILGGDVHLGAVGQFYSNKKLRVAKDRDHRYMPNIISSAIVNTPPPVFMSDVLNKRNKVHHLDPETDEDMIPMFEADVDGKPRNNHHLLPRRNYCVIREYIPGSTPPASPGPEAQTPSSNRTQGQGNRQYPPSSMKRTLSRPGNLIRRLSGSRSRGGPVPPTPDQTQTPYDPNVRRGSLGVGERQSESGTRPPSTDHGSYFPPGATASQPVRPTNTFLRRPTNLSERAAVRAAAKGGADANLDGREPGHINLENGLDISLNMEINQHDPAGHTVPYRLLVPALWYEGQPDVNDARVKSKGAALMDRLRGRGKDRGNEEDPDGSESRSRSPSRELTGSGRPGGSVQGPPAANRSKPPGLQVGKDGRYDGNDFVRDDRHYSNDTMPSQTNLPLPSDQPQSRYGANSNNRINSDQTREETHYHNNGYIPSRGGQPLSPEQNSQPSNVPPTRQPLQTTLSDSAPRPSRFPQRLFGWRRNTESTQPYGQEQRYSDDSDADSQFSESEPDSVDAPPPRQRRPSKAERFFGIGDDKVWGGDGKQRAQETGPNGLPYDGKKPGWKIWK